jgi:octaprenyl-diphosphate synthase
MSASAFFQAVDGKVSNEVLDLISSDVARVEQELDRQVGSQIGTVELVGQSTLKAGGKRLRPAILGIAARATGRPFDSERAIRLGACMEMIHMATLIHDDVIDQSPLRRGQPTAHTQVGATPAILAGDVLLAKAMVLLAEDGDLQVIRTVSQMVVEMAEGEVRELEVRNQFDLSEREHMEVLRMKTAAFIECCCLVGAMIATDDLATIQALRDYGAEIGLAFQIVDDLLDYRSNDTGKPKAGDFREGQATLPLILLRKSLNNEEYAFAQRHFGTEINGDDLTLLTGWMRDRGAFDEAESRAERHVEIALAALERLPNSESRTLLESVSGLVLSRSR